MRADSNSNLMTKNAISDIKTLLAAMQLIPRLHVRKLFGFVLDLSEQLISIKNLSVLSKYNSKKKIYSDFAQM